MSIFKTRLVLKDIAGSHPEAMAISDSVVRSLSRKEGHAFAQSLFESVEMISLHTPAGLYLGKKAAFGVDYPRLDRVVARVVRGLYWYHHNKAHLPPEFSVAAHCLDGMDLKVATTYHENMMLLLKDAPIHVTGRGVLRYRFTHGEGKPRTAWVLQFYDDVTFIAWIAEKERLPDPG